jgi:hypothetical protein
MRRLGITKCFPSEQWDDEERRAEDWGKCNSRI